MKFLKKNLFSIISFLLAIAIMLYFFISTKGFSQLVEIMQARNPVWLALALACMCLYWFLEGAVIFVYTKKLYPKNKMLSSFNIGMIGLLYSALTPFSTGGQPMQLYAMKKQGLDSGKSVSVLAMKSIAYQVSLAVYSVASIVFCFGYFSENIAAFSAVAAIGLSVNILVIFLMLVFTLNKRWTERLVNGSVGLLHAMHIVKDKEKTKERLSEQTSCFNESAQLFKGDVRVQVIAFILSCVEFTFLFLVPYCIFRYFGLDGGSVIHMVAAQAFINMIAAYVPLPGAAGVAEGSFYVFFGLFFPENAIVPAILLWRLLTYCGNIIFGTVIVLFENRRNRRRALQSVAEASVEN